MGLCSIRCCRALLRTDGTLVSPVQSWMDLRLAAPYRHEDGAVCYVTTATGYLTHRLTGETRDTRSNYVGPWPIDPDTLDWYEDKAQFNAYTPPEMLFDLVDPAGVLGTITEPPAGPPACPQASCRVHGNDKPWRAWAPAWRMTAPCSYPLAPILLP